MRLWPGGQLSSSAASLSVRGDGATALVATDAVTAALSVSAAASAFTQTVVAVLAVKAAAADFYLITVRAVAWGFRGAARLG